MHNKLMANNEKDHLPKVMPPKKKRARKSSRYSCARKRAMKKTIKHKKAMRNTIKHKKAMKKIIKK